MERFTSNIKNMWKVSVGDLVWLPMAPLNGGGYDEMYKVGTPLEKMDKGRYHKLTYETLR